ncbi:hypothetical protein VTI74DRAFT_11504 [Chaetomium olivicolor]
MHLSSYTPRPRSTVDSRTIFACPPNPSAHNPDNPALFQSAPSHPNLEVRPAYWFHACPLSSLPRNEHHQYLPPAGFPIEGVRCSLGCGEVVGGSTELHNFHQQAIETVGGKNLMKGRFERWWMRCSLCGGTWRNYLEDHPRVGEERQRGQRWGVHGLAGLRVIADAGDGGEGRLLSRKCRVAEKCASCAVPFTVEFAVPLNRFGEDIREVVRRDETYRRCRLSGPSSLGKVDRWEEAPPGWI